LKKILIFGGINSGKSAFAEKKILEISNKKPYYIATYLEEFCDNEMKEKIKNHKLKREGNFINLEEPYDVNRRVKEGESYLVDCLSMLIFNNLDNQERLFEQLELLSSKDSDIVFVLNDVSSGVLPADYESRTFVKLSGLVAQMVADFCDEVYEVKFGLVRQWK